METNGNGQTRAITVGVVPMEFYLRVKMLAASRGLSIAALVRELLQTELLKIEERQDRKNGHS